MNVLLAEADIPYDKLLEMEDVNSEMRAGGRRPGDRRERRREPSRAPRPGLSPIYGMPILDVDKAHTVMVIKRSMNPGFAGIENELFYLDRTLMLFGDAKAFVTGLVKELSSAH